MTQHYTGKVFKTGDSAVVSLPEDVASVLGTEVTIERRGNEVVLRPRSHTGSDWRSVSPEEALARNRALAADLRAVWADYDGPRPVPELRDRDIFPDRPGLY